MAKKEFYDAVKILDKVPELATLVPVKDGCEVGISSAENLKYKEPDEYLLKIVPAEKILPNVYEKLLLVMTGETSPSVIKSVAPPVLIGKAISVPDFRTLFPDVIVPHADKTYDIVAEGNMLYARRFGKKGKLSRDIVAFSDPQARMAAIDIVQKVHGNKGLSPLIASKMSRRKEEVLKIVKDIRAALYKKTEGIGTLQITTEGPCLYFTLFLGNVKNQKKAFRLDGDEDILAEASKWAEKSIASLVAAYNNTQYKRRFEILSEALREGLEKLFEGKQIHLKKCDLGDPVSVSCCLPGEAYISTSTKAGICFLDEYVSNNPVGDIGRVQYVISKEGKKWVRAKGKEIFAGLMHASWKADSVPRKIDDTIYKGQRDYIDRYSIVRVPLLWGKRTDIVPSRKFHYDMKTGSFFAENKVGTFVLRNGTVKFTPTDLYKTSVKEAESKRNAAARKYFSSLREEYAGAATLTFLSGSGILFGETQIKAEGGNARINYSWKTPSYKDSLPAWKKQARKNMAELVAALKAEQEKNKALAIKAFGSLAGNFIAIDAANFISVNGKYITENAAIHYLRGMSQTFHGHINDTDAYSRYKPLSSEDVEDVIDEMIRKGIIDTKTLKGTYGYFDILKPTDKSRMLTRENCERIPDSTVETILERGGQINDTEAEKYFMNFLKKEHPETADYLKVTNLVRAKGFVCTHYDKYIDVLRSAPEDIKMYLKMRKEVTEDRLEKKVLIAAGKKKQADQISDVGESLTAARTGLYR